MSTGDYTLVLNIHPKGRVGLDFSSESAPTLASFPGLPHFCSSIYIDNNARKWKSGKKWERPVRIHQAISLNTVEQSCLQHLESPLTVK